MDGADGIDATSSEMKAQWPQGAEASPVANRSICLRKGDAEGA